MSDPQDIPDDVALAAEYVLRLLEPEAEQAFEARLHSEPHLRAHVTFWEAEFANLVDEDAKVAPPAGVKERLLGEIGGDVRPARRWGFGWLAFPAAVAVALVAFFAFAPMLSGPSFDPTLHATLISADGAVHIEAGYAPDGNLFKVIHEDGTPLPGRAFELWIIGEGASAPVSLGLVPLGSEALFEIDAKTAALIDGGTLAISDEPAGGSPTGAPTGAVLASDAFFDI
jgi:anti-sigma-K factor RskA